MVVLASIKVTFILSHYGILKKCEAWGIISPISCRDSSDVIYYKCVTYEDFHHNYNENIPSYAVHLFKLMSYISKIARNNDLNWHRKYRAKLAHESFKIFWTCFLSCVMLSRSWANERRCYICLLSIAKTLLRHTIGLCRSFRGSFTIHQIYIKPCTGYNTHGDTGLPNTTQEPLCDDIILINIFNGNIICSNPNCDLEICTKCCHVTASLPLWCATIWSNNHFVIPSNFVCKFIMGPGTTSIHKLYLLSNQLHICIHINSENWN